MSPRGFFGYIHIELSTAKPGPLVAERAIFYYKLPFTAWLTIGSSFIFLEVWLWIHQVISLYTESLHYPKAHKLIDSSTTYVYDHRTQTYLQPSFSNQLLQRILNVNKKILEKLTVSRDVPFEKRAAVPAGTPLIQLISIASTETHLAPSILSTVLEELGRQET